MTEPETTPASFVYSFAIEDDDPALSRLPEDVRGTIESRIVDVIYESFVTSADEDYLSARVLAVKGLPRAFAWGAGQALEKYFKAFLLLRGRKVNGNEFRGHPIRKLYNAVVELDPAIASIDMTPHPNINAELRIKAHIKTIPLPEFIDIIERIGDPGNRYNAAGVDFDTNYVFALDAFVHGFRSRIGAPPIDLSFKRLDNDILAPFWDNNPYFCAADASHSKVSTHSFKLLWSLGCTMQEYLLKNEQSWPNMHALNWLRRRMRI